MAICHCDPSIAETEEVLAERQSVLTDALPYGNEEIYQPFTMPRYCEVPPETGFRLTFNHVTAALMRRHRLEEKTVFYPHLKLMSMPLDIILEVFGHLHPLDLYHLGMSNRQMRSLVVPRAALSLWRSSFTRHPEVPPCPPDMAEPQWAAFLFGPANCDICHQRPGVPIWGFRKRYCHICRSEAFSFKITWSGHQPDEVTELIVRLPTHIDRLLQTHTRTVLFKRADLEQAQEDFKSLSRLPQIEREIQVAEITSRVNAIIDHHVIALKWAKNLYRELDRAQISTQIKAKEGFRKRLRRLGYAEKEIKTFIATSGLSLLGTQYRPIFSINDRAWRILQASAIRTTDMILAIQNGQKGGSKPDPTCNTTSDAPLCA